MNKYISDRDLGLNCDHISRGETDSEVLDNATSHLKEYHEMDYDRLKSRLSSSIKSGEDPDDVEGLI